MYTYIHMNLGTAFSCLKIRECNKNLFSYFSTKTYYVVDTQRRVTLKCLKDSFTRKGFLFAKRSFEKEFHFCKKDIYFFQNDSYGYAC